MRVNLQAMTDQEMWQWIHYSYGEDLGLQSDDDDYIALSSEDKVQFQKQLQMEEKLAEQCSDSSLLLDTSTNKVWKKGYSRKCGWIIGAEFNRTTLPIFKTYLYLCTL